MSQPSAEHDLALVRMVTEAKAAGLTWAQIGSAILGRPDAKAAKNHVRKAARRANAAAAAAIAQEGVPGG